ncbi:MAG: hypothetical protein IJS69_02450 [Selenomonadaceae bacterium]|nr:hypothetical protein [Selenomonadaceae bacterium]
MSNEEKILEMLAAIQSDIEKLKSDVSVLRERKEEDSLAKLSPEERTARVMAALDAFQKACAEDPEGTEKFFAIMDEKEARRNALYEKEAQEARRAAS